MSSFLKELSENCTSMKGQQNAKVEGDLAVPAWAGSSSYAWPKDVKKEQYQASLYHLGSVEKARSLYQNH
jgi:hypothetical protein